MNNETEEKTESSANLHPFEPDEEFKRAWTEIYDRQSERPKVASTNDVISSGVGNNRDPQFNQNANRSKRPSRRKVLKRAAVVILTLTVLYCVAVFSNIPFIAKWRTIYIETAMGTMRHHWLATLFIPKSVIDQVVYNTRTLDDLQSGLSSNWNVSEFSKSDLYLPWNKAKNKFSSIYGEIDQESFQDYFDQHSDEILNDDNYLLIDKTGLQESGTSIKTIYGDQVLAIDTINAITIIKITGDGYVGRLAIIKDPSRVGIGLSEGFDKTGATVGALAEYNNAVLAINASGFYDPEGHGNGGNAYGLVISKGKVYKEAVGLNYKIIALDKNDKLNIGEYRFVASFRDAVEFKPALIIDGQTLVTESAGWGIQPRSAVGQTKNGEFLILIVDGRAPGYSIGCTVGELAQILNRYGAYQACNLDGGSSSLLYYNGRVISKPSAANKVDGRGVPNGFVVYNRTK